MIAGLPECALVLGIALDLTTTDPEDCEQCNFSRHENRQRARGLFRKQMPLFLIASAMRTELFTPQALNNSFRDAQAVVREMVEARIHLEFVELLTNNL